MAKRNHAAILDAISTGLNSLPAVFSTAQWGGRAYKVPGSNGSKKKAKLLAHVCADQEKGVVTASFKLAKERAKRVVREFDWIEPHSFRTLAPSGWLTATVRTKTQSKALLKLLAESRTLYRNIDSAQDNKKSKRKSADPTAAHIHRVMKSKKDEGWKPKDDFKD